MADTNACAGCCKRTLRSGLRGRLGALHAGQGLGYPPEKSLDVVAELGTRLDEHEVVLLGFVLALLRRDLALVVQIRLVAHEHDDDVVAALRSHVVDPLLGILEGFRVYWARQGLDFFWRCLAGIEP